MRVFHVTSYIKKKIFTSSDSHREKLFCHSHSFWHLIWKYKYCNLFSNILFCHFIWHSILTFVYSGILSFIYSKIFSGILLGILSDILVGIYSDIVSGFLSGILYLAFYLTFCSGILCCTHSAILSGIYFFWHSFWHSNWHFLPNILSSIYSDILFGMGTAGPQPQAPDLSGHCRTWAPDLELTQIWRPRLRSCCAHWDPKFAVGKSRRKEGGWGSNSDKI